MIEDEFDRIKKLFVCFSDECFMEVVCLFIVMKYYGG